MPVGFQKVLQILILQHIDGVLPPNLFHGINHCGKDYQKHAPHSDGDAVPGDEERPFQPIGNGAVNQPGYGKGHGNPIEQPLHPIEQAFEIHHLPESLRRHADGFEHGELPLPQTDVGGNGIEHICRRNQGNQGDEPEGKHIDDSHHCPFPLDAGRIIVQAVGGQAPVRQLLAHGGLSHLVVCAFKNQFHRRKAGGVFCGFNL